MRRLEIIPDYNRLEESIALAKEYNCTFEYNDFFLPSVLEDVKKQEMLIKTYQSTGRDLSKDTLHGAFFDVTIHSVDSRIREISELRMRQSMEIARKMGVESVVFHSGRIQNLRTKEYLDNWKQKNLLFYTQLCKEYPEINIYVENMFDEAADILADLANELCGIKNFGICLDYAHAAIVSQDMDEWFDALSPYIRHMHINDNDLTADQHLAVGSGKIDWSAYKERIKKYNICGSVLVEVTKLETQREALSYMREHEIDL